MSAQPLDELFAGHGGPWTEAEWLALPESMGTVELLEYAEPARAAPAGLLVLNQPFEVTLNLPALARATR